MCSTDTPSLMHSCMSSAISSGEHGSAGFRSFVLMLPVVASVMMSLPWSFCSAVGFASGSPMLSLSRRSPQRIATGERSREHEAPPTRCSRTARGAGEAR